MLKNKELYLLLFEREKRKFVRINLVVENFLFVSVCFFETKNIYSHTHSTYAGGWVIKNFHPTDCRKQDYFFFWPCEFQQHYFNHFCLLPKILHCVKYVRIQGYSGRHFPAFGLNTERYFVALYI